MPSDNDIVQEARKILSASNAYTLRIQVRELLGALTDEVGRLRDLVVHMHVHSGYRNNGYMQMTTPQKALYDAIWQRSVEELDAEEGDHHANS